MRFRHRITRRPPYRPGPPRSPRLLRRLRRVLPWLSLGLRIVASPQARERVRAALRDLWAWLPFD